MSLLDLRGFWANPADTLAATPTGIANVTATLSVAHALAATAIGVGASSAAVSVQHNLATTPIGVGRVTAALSESHNLAGAATGVASVSAALSVGSTVSASGGGASTSRWPLTATRKATVHQLEAVVLGAGWVAGNLTVTSRPPAFILEELEVIATLVDEEELKVLMEA